MVPCSMNGEVMAGKEVVLKQQNKSGLNFQVKLIEGRELQVVNSNKKTNHSYSIDILSLQDKSKKVFFIAWKWLASSILLFLTMLVLLKILPGYLGENKNIYLGVILLVGSVGSIVSFIQFFKRTSRKQIFCSRNAHVPIITLSASLPTKQAVSEFVDIVEKRIKKFRAHMDVSEDKQLTGEMKMLRRLSESGIINTKDYEAAKGKLFSGFDGANTNK